MTISTLNPSEQHSNRKGNKRASGEVSPQTSGVNFTCAKSAHLAESSTYATPTFVGCAKSAQTCNPTAKSQVQSNQSLNRFGVPSAKYPAEVQNTPQTRTASRNAAVTSPVNREANYRSAPLEPVETSRPSGPVPQAVIFIDAKGTIDAVCDGEPFVLGTGAILAVRAADGSVHRMPLGKGRKYSTAVDQVLALLGNGEKTQ